MPAVLAVEALGFEVTASDDGVRASKDGAAYLAEDPVALLGLIRLVEVRSREWRATDEEIARTLDRFGWRRPQTGSTAHAGRQQRAFVLVVSVLVIEDLYAMDVGERDCAAHVEDRVQAIHVGGAAADDEPAMSHSCDVRVRVVLLLAIDRHHQDTQFSAHLLNYRSGPRLRVSAAARLRIGNMGAARWPGTTW